MGLEWGLSFEVQTLHSLLNGNQLESNISQPQHTKASPNANGLAVDIGGMRLPLRITSRDLLDSSPFKRRDMLKRRAREVLRQALGGTVEATGGSQPRGSGRRSVWAAARNSSVGRVGWVDERTSSYVIVHETTKRNGDKMFDHLGWGLGVWGGD